MLEVSHNIVVWSGKVIGKVIDDVAILYVGMHDLVEYRFHEALDIIEHLDEIVVALNRMGLQVESEYMLDCDVGELMRLYDEAVKYG